MSHKSNLHTPSRQRVLQLTLTAALLLTAGVAQASNDATSLQSRLKACTDRYAVGGIDAVVTLTCQARDGKLEDCKPTSATPANRGFENAAVCVAAFLPMGTRVGEIHIPIRFTRNED